MHKKWICEEFEIKKLGKYHDLYLKSDVLLLADVFENFRKMYLKIYESDPVKFISDPGLAWQATLRWKKVKLELLTDSDLLFCLERVIEDEYVLQFIGMQKLIINIWKIMIKIKNCHILIIGM